MADRTMVYTVRYQFGTYAGNRVVQAESQDDAIAKVKRWARQQRCLPMAYESYKVIERREP